MSKCKEIVEYFGGTVLAFRNLMEMHRLGASRRYKCTNGKIAVCHLINDVWGYTPNELEVALEETLFQEVRLRHKPQSVEYVDAGTYPEVYNKREILDGFTVSSKTPPLILKTEYKGEVRYVTGCMYEYNDGRPNVYHLDGHNGNWHNTVKGWAYC